MPTLGRILGAVRHRLAGVGVYEDASCELKTPLGPTDLTVMVDAISGAVTRGVYEIGLELIRVKSVDAGSATLTLPSYGRGYKGTTPAAHAAGAEVVVNPMWPAATVAAELNGVLHELYPSLYAVKQFEGVYAEPFTIPADATGVVAVYRQGANAAGWDRLDTWWFEPDAGNGLRSHLVRSGETLRVVYAARPGVFDLDVSGVLSQDFETVTGLDARVADLLALGVAYRLAPFTDVARLTATGAEARTDPQSKPAASGANASRLLLAEFTQRLQQEQAVLNKEHPIRVHRLKGARLG